MNNLFFVFCICSVMMSKRRRSAGPAARTTVLDSALVEFKVDYNETKRLADGEAVYSDVVSAGGHAWRIKCHPSAECLTGRKTSLCITVEHVSKSRCAKAIVEAFLLNRYGHPSLTAKKRSWTLCFCDATYSKEWHWFLPLVDPLLENHLVDGQFTVVCTIMVLQDSSIPVPPSDITNHLGALLDSADGTDVSFDVDGETFHAHRAVLATRSPVFRAELLGSMAEATMPCIPLQGIAPATFREMLRFMYTDSLTGGEKELGDTLTSSEMIQDLLDAADRYEAYLRTEIVGIRIC
jgi:speckle-type POZ protein